MSLLAIMSPLIAVPVNAAAAPPAAARSALLTKACGPRGGPAPTDVPWPLRRLDPSAVWPLTQGEGVTVAVIDSGVSDRNPALAGQVLNGRDFGLSDTGGHCDKVGHGTVIAGIIAGRRDAKVPFYGIAPRAKILPVRVMNGDKSNDDALPGRIARAIIWAVDHGADVINLSLETVPVDALANAVDYAHSKDVVLVAAAGNQPSGQQRDQPAYPAGYDSVIAVAGIDQEGKHVDSSISGDYIDVAAPGLMIEGPGPADSGYLTATKGGTSFAAAYVSGVAALIRSRHPGATADEVARRITFTADNPPEGRNATVGYGLVNPYRAVTTTLGQRKNPPVGALVPVAPEADPQAGAKKVAVVAALVGALIALVLLLGAPVIRRGRRRGWAPGGNTGSIGLGDARSGTADPTHDATG